MEEENDVRILGENIRRLAGNIVFQQHSDRTHGVSISRFESQSLSVEEIFRVIARIRPNLKNIEIFARIIVQNLSRE